MAFDNLTVQKGVPAAAKSRFSNAPPAAPLMKGAKMVRIVLEDSNDIPPNGLFIGHNGNSYMIRSSMEVNAPAPLLEILDNAITSVPIINPHTQQVVGYREKRRFPYRIIHEKDAA